MAKVPTIAPIGLLEGKVAIITGAGTGIGLAAALGFAQAGAKVALVGRRQSLIDEAANQVVSAGGEALAIRADVAKEDCAQRMVDVVVSVFGRLDVAFNNAGLDPNPPRAVAEETLEQWNAIFAVKAVGTFLSMKYQIPAMIKAGAGAIVNNSSVVAFRSKPHLASPSASQAAVVGLTNSAAAAYGRNNIRVNAIATGKILTPERARGIGAGHHVDDPTYCPLGRSGRAEEVAAAAAWLCSDFASYVTGACLSVDGGRMTGG